MARSETKRPEWTSPKAALEGADTERAGGGLALEMWRADDNGAAIADSRLQERVFEVFETVAELRTAELRVVVRHRAVTLSGRVASDFERLTAERLARQVAGIRVVRNQLRVVPRTSPVAAQP